VTPAVATISGAPDVTVPYQLLFESNPNPMWVLDGELQPELKVLFMSG
jgi:hypothetical protein